MNARQAFADALTARRVVARFVSARDYKEYVEEKKQKGEKPLDKAEWEARTQGGEEKGEGKKDEPKEDEPKKNDKAKNPTKQDALWAAKDDAEYDIDAFMMADKKDPQRKELAQSALKSGQKLLRELPTDHPKFHAFNGTLGRLQESLKGDTSYDEEERGPLITKLKRLLHEVKIQKG